MTSDPRRSQALIELGRFCDWQNVTTWYRSSFEHLTAGGSRLRTSAVQSSFLKQIFTKHLATFLWPGVYTDIGSWPRQDFLPAQVRFFHDYLNIFLHFGTVTPRARAVLLKKRNVFGKMFLKLVGPRSEAIPFRVLPFAGTTFLMIYYDIIAGQEIK